MNRFFQSLLSAIAVITLSCNQANNPKPTAMNTVNTPAGPETAESAPTRQPSKYETHGILDPGINNMVAFAMQTPRGWKMQQSFTRIWNRSVPIAQVYIKLVSPNGDNTLEYLPSTSYFYTDGPMARQMRQMTASYGQAMPHTPGEMMPMPAMEYLRRILLPQLNQHGLNVRVTNQHVLPGSQSQGTTISNAYADGILSDGRKVRVECLVNLYTTRVNSEMYYNWTVTPTVTQSRSNLDEAFSSLIHGRKSIVINPAWQKLNQQLVNNGNVANNNTDRQNAAIAKDARDYTNKIITETYEQRSKSQDRNNEAFSDMIRGEGKFENPETGERTKTSDMYNHVYQDGQGNTYGSNTPVDAGQLNWTELQRVETKNY